MSSIPGARRAAFPENKSREEKKHSSVEARQELVYPGGKRIILLPIPLWSRFFFRSCCCYYVTGSLGCLCDTPRFPWIFLSFLLLSRSYFCFWYSWLLSLNLLLVLVSRHHHHFFSLPFVPGHTNAAFITFSLSSFFLKHFQMSVIIGR